MKKIINLKELSNITHRDRSRLYRLISEGRLKAQYQDSEGHYYWSIKKADEIAAVIKEQSATRKPGRGGKITFDKVNNENEESAE
ncbi:MAG: hypothetical protein C0392_01065 [Syntrophus sp. (in: bacteria)]|nr:hypothetical protein [Syntrophus sp. (in: bacteria)]